MLELKNITVAYKNKRVLNDLSATAKNGECIAVLGSNGAGKSTLFKTIMGMTQLANGELYVDGTLINNYSYRERAAHISILHQNPLLGSIDTMTVRENCALALYRGKTVSLRNGLTALQNSDLLGKLFALFPEIEPYLDLPVENLSGGQRQFLAFGLALLLEPKVLLLDEPTAALDEGAAERMLKIIKETHKKNNTTILLIMHSIEEALATADKVWILKAGTIAHSFNTTDQACAPETIRAILFK